MQTNKIFKILVLLLSFMILNAEEIVLKKGESKVYTTSSKITTIFTSNPAIADYKIISNNKLVIYALGNGYANIKLFGGDNSVLLASLDVAVDPVAGELKRIEREIMDLNPGVTLEIKRLSEPGKRAYILLGEVPDDGTRDYVYSMASLALGVKSGGGGGSSGGGGGDGGGDDAGGGGDTGGGDGGGGDAGGGDGGGGDGGSSSSGGKPNFLKGIVSTELIDKLIITGNNQVNVKLIVADVDKELSEQLGIDWNISSLKFDALKLVGGGAKAGGGGGANFATFSEAVAGAGSAAAGIIPVIKALKNDKAARILAEPNLSVLSGEEASFTIENQFTTFEEKTSEGGVAISRGPTIKPTLQLKISPKIYNKSRIKLKISQALSNIYRFDQKSETTIADMKTRKTESTIELADGESFVIAGLIDERDIETVSSVPFLGDIPFLGALFRSTGITKQKSELIIIATVNITKSNKDGHAYKLPSFRARNLAESLVNVTFNKGANVDRELKFFVENIGFIR